MKKSGKTIWNAAFGKGKAKKNAQAALKKAAKNAAKKVVKYVIEGKGLKGALLLYQKDMIKGIIDSTKSTYKKEGFWYTVGNIMFKVLLGLAFKKLLGGKLKGSGAGPSLKKGINWNIKKYGILAYKDLRKVIKGTGLQAHHIVEGRFAKTLKLKRNSMLCTAVTKEQHQMFTNKWRKAIPYGTKKPTKTELWEAAKEVYKGYPKLKKAAKETIYN